MIIRFHRGQFVDAVVPTDVNLTLNQAPGDILWQIPADINPSKTVTEKHPKQAVDSTGAPIFNENGPVYETTTIQNADGTETVQTIYEDVPVTYSLLGNPNIFTQDDIKAVAISYQVVS